MVNIFQQKCLDLDTRWSEIQATSFMETHKLLLNEASFQMRAYAKLEGKTAQMEGEKSHHHFEEKRAIQRVEWNGNNCR